MKIKATLLTSITAGLLLASAATNAQTIAFDIETGSNTQTGFTSVTSFPTDDGTVTLSVDTTPDGFRDRGVSSPIDGDPDEAIMRDLAFWSTSDPIIFTFTGLQANTEYNATTWAFDAESGNSGKNIDFTTSNGTVSITTSDTDASYNPISLATIVTSGSGVGTITMEHTGGAGGAVSFTNGFELSVVPEPSSFALLAGMFGLTWVMLRRRA